MGNIVNRVFDSSGPEGKVRGTPQQIIDKYVQLARDASLGNDRVAAENFQQHAEHYTRMLGEAQREQDARREQQESQQRDRQRDRHEGDGAGDLQDTGEDSDDQNDSFYEADGMQSVEPMVDESDLIEDEDDNAPQPSFLGETLPMDAGNGLVETPESQPKPRKPRSRKPRPEMSAASGDGPAGDVAARPRRPRLNRAKPEVEAAVENGAGNVERSAEFGE